MKKTSVILPLIVVTMVVGSVAIPLLFQRDYGSIVSKTIDRDTVSRQDFASVMAHKKTREEETEVIHTPPEAESPLKTEEKPQPESQPSQEKPLPEIKDDWLQEQIDKNRDQIDEADLEEGLTIYNQLDAEYLFGLLEDGLTEEEKALFKGHLEAHLSGEELDRAMALYREYVGLVK